MTSKNPIVRRWLLPLALTGIAHGAIIETDVCVYGGGAGGVTAAVQVRRMGKSVSLLNFGNHLGGLSSSGLGATDVGNFGNTYIQGLSREFYTRLGAKYGGTGARFNFEPKVAEQVFNEMAAQAGVPVYHFSRIASATMDGSRIREITMENGDIFRAKMFLDASYEGDLLKMAGVTYTVGREANSKYNETKNGIQRTTSGHQFNQEVDPYVIQGNPASGLLPGVNPNPAEASGSADGLLQAYCFRLCLTNNPANRVMIARPEGYNEADYELLFRWIETNPASFTNFRFWSLSSMPNSKTDSNNNGAISFDFIGGNNNYVEVGHAAREQVVKAHEKWQRGLIWTIQNHPRIPAAVRSANAAWGLPLDEFPDNNHWPYELYIREARRMVSDHVMTQHHCAGTVVAPDSIGLAAYTMDSHNTQRYVNANGKVRNEGDVQIGVSGPYPISYRSIVPKAGECTNLLVPWCLSASHISFGSFRMEPVYMIVGQSAATAACFAIDDNVPVQQVSYPKLKAQLLADGQRLTYTTTAEQETGTIVDNADAAGVTVTGDWLASSATSGYHGADYLHNDSTGAGAKSVRFTPTLPAAGEYTVYLRWTQHSNRAAAIPVDVLSTSGTSTKVINQTANGSLWFSLGNYNFNAGSSAANGSVLIRTDGTTGYVIADAVKFVSTSAPAPPVTVALWGTNTGMAEPIAGPGTAGKITVSRSGETGAPLVVNLSISGTATNGTDCSLVPASITIPVGAASTSVTITPAADLIAEGTETLGISLAAGGYVADTPSSAVLAIADRPFDAWRHLRFGGAQLGQAEISSGTADPDHDGSGNLIEYLAGRNPLTPEHGGWGTRGISLIGGAEYQTLDFTVTKTGDVICIPEVSGNLREWNSGGGFIESTILSDDGTIQRIKVRDLTPRSSGDKRFIRLRAERAR